MIINSQAFNAKGKDARRIYMKLDEFRSRRPIDIIAKTNPILIIDEPQSVEGKQTKERLKEFRPLLTLRYSATHKSDSIYNMVVNLFDHKTISVFLQAAGIIVKVVADLDNSALFLGCAAGHPHLELQGGGGINNNPQGRPQGNNLG